VAAVVIVGAVVFFAGCSATTRHRVLTTMFDGVPPLRPSTPVAATTAGRQGPAFVVPRVHGPYAAKLCSACHVSKAGNALVSSPEQLCLRCHQFEFGGNYVHGPLAAGGCRACHEPHSSPYRYLLVSESELFCFHCHDRERLRGHAGDEPKCTSCHDAHMSAKKFLLK
jgi:predicted CXXCH cytochrome family protein